jgi:hypothetical protein
METNETPQNHTLPDDLSPTQIAAVAALLAGKTVTDAAAEAGVDRWTVHAWLKSHFAFRAAMNRGRRDLQKAVRRKLARMIGKALDCVERAIDDGDAKAAMDFLKDVQALRDPFGYSDVKDEDPDELAADTVRRAAAEWRNGETDGAAYSEACEKAYDLIQRAKSGDVAAARRVLYESLGAP